MSKPKRMVEMKEDYPGRHGHVAMTQHLAKKHGTCKEEYHGGKMEGESGCLYPHCDCLYGMNGPIDPETGEEMKRP